MSKYKEFEYKYFAWNDLEKFIDELQKIKEKANKEGHDSVRVMSHGVGCMLTFQVKK